MYLFKLQKNFDIKIEKNWILLKTNSGSKMGKFKDPFTLFTVKNDKLYILNKKRLNLNIIYSLKNLLNGLNKQFSVKLSIIGLGYKINLIDPKTLVLHLGYSHTIKYELPYGIIMKHPKERVSTYLLIGDEYNKLKQVALNLINLKKPEPYKGKGIRYFNQIIKLKEGKKSNN